MNAYLAKLKTIGVMSRQGSSRRSVERTDSSSVVTTEHWDGRQDATVRPDVIRHGARVHTTGRKKGEIAEIRRLSNKEAKERHGD